MPDSSPSKDILLKVYDSAIAEYRFNVQLSWDRNKFFLTLVSAIIASGVGFIKVASENRVDSAFLFCLFAVAVAITSYAIETLSTGKKYIREANYKKMLIERELGLLNTIPNFNSPRSNFAVAVTGGQRNFGSMMLSEDIKKSISQKSITDNLAKIYAGMIVIEIIGCIISAGMVIGPLDMQAIKTNVRSFAERLSHPISQTDVKRSLAVSPH
ncbi:hypothetical protein [Lichenibacterium dinghuense]|uniref:RipA family octameric membrane protein n=1 Tax=Lichenibacterium dinghuense TaxID=2895977 RepID=UPI001F259F28|nr:hypothetical protein [Lichenibacterium sp. 6Y81]